MQRMARVGICVLAVASAGAIGCTSRGSQLWVYPHRNAETLAQSKEDHNRAVIGVADHDRRAIIDDLDIVYMTDRPSRLSRWHTP